MGRRPHNYRQVKYITLLDETGIVQTRFELDNNGRFLHGSLFQSAIQYHQKVIPQQMTEPLRTSSSLLPPSLREKPEFMFQCFDND